MADDQRKLIVREASKLLGLRAEQQWVAEQAVDELEPGWKAHLDKRSNRTYFHNARSGETKWTLPIDVKRYKEIANLAKAKGDRTLPLDKASTGKPQLPEGWSEHLDSKSGRPYYFNQELETTVWHRPRSGGKVSSSSGSTLPSGWKQHTDQKSGRLFFHNAELGKSSWVPPPALQNKIASLNQILKQASLEEFEEAFNKQGLTNVDDIANDVSEEDLINDFGMNKYQARKLIRFATSGSTGKGGGGDAGSRFRVLLGGGAGSFELLSIDRNDRLGSGGFGTVYGGKARVLGRTFDVAVKVPSEQLSIEAKDVFVQECRDSLEIAMSCEHGVCKVYALCESGDFGLCLVMRRYDHSLADEIHRSLGRGGGSAPLLPVRAARVAFDICRGMAQLHAHGVLLRDLKPANVLVDAESGEAFVTDFGLAHVLDAAMTSVGMSATTAALAGTPAYMSPEQVVNPSRRPSEGSKGEDLLAEWRRVTPKSDVWNFGCTLLEMLTARVPWSGHDRLQVMLNLRERRAPPLGDSTLPPGELAVLVRDCLESRPSQRPSFADILRRLRVVVSDSSSNSGGRVGPSHTLVPSSDEMSTYNPSSLTSTIDSATTLERMGRDATATPKRAFVDRVHAEPSTWSFDGSLRSETLTNPPGSSVEGSITLTVSKPALSLASRRRLSSISDVDENDDAWIERQEQDMGEGLGELRRLAEDGVPEAQFNLALRYETGDGGTGSRDYTTAAKWYEKAADSGLAEAQYNFANALRLGRGVPKDERRAFTLFKLAAEQGDDDAQFALANLFDDGIGTVRDRSAAVHWFAKAAEQGNRSAMYNAALAFEIGRGVEADLTRSVALYTKSAERGCARAQFKMANLYHAGKCVEQSDARATEWYRKAAEQGIPEAQFNLANAYRNGRGVRKDDSKAFEWYEKAAKLGDDDAQFNIANMYDDGVGVARDRRMAMHWFTKSAEAGKAAAQYNLALFHARGWAGQRDPKAAFKWFKAAAEKGVASSMYNVGMCYHKGDGVDSNERSAFTWMLRSAEAGDEDAALNVGARFMQGVGTSKNTKQAIHWFERAAEKGKTDAMFKLANLYSEGEYNGGVAKAIAWYTRAADEGMPEAQYNLAVHYQRGDGVAQDRGKAFSLFLRSAKQGDRDAQCAVGKYFLAGVQGVVKKDENQGSDWLAKAADQDLPRAQYLLGNNYYLGRGVTKSIATAVRLFKRAAEQGVPEAQFMLAMRYDKGEGLPMDKAKAVAWYTKSAEQGDDDAQYNLGVSYFNGEGCTIDKRKALRLWKLSAAQGNRQAVDAIEKAGRMGFS